MARENQGLQIALIVFVMLTIILSVTAYLFYRQYQEADGKGRQAQADVSKAQDESRKNAEEASKLKQLLTGSESEVREDLVQRFNNDVKKYGSAFAEEERYYRPMLEKTANALAEKSEELVKAKAEIESWRDKYAIREASKEPEIKKLEERAAQAEKEKDTARTQFEADGSKLREDATKVHADMTEAVKKAKTEVENAVAKIEASDGKLKKMTRQYQDKAHDVQRLTSQTFDAPLGEVRWVNQRTGTVWVDLGRSDSLARQVSFGVYPADISNLTLSAKKAGIEITQVISDHLAEARITDDKADDPIMPGDKIYTPVWTPGEKKHFALTGVLDVDGDGRNDVRIVINLITLNGGVVDCYLDEKGEIVGQMTPNTRYLVIGDRPDDTQETQVKGNATMNETAASLGVASIALPELLERMSWKNPTPVVHYGRDANLRDFKVKGPEGAQKKSSGNVFVPRDPPQRNPKSAY
jgi:hypothetical protein